MNIAMVDLLHYLLRTSPPSTPLGMTA